MSECRFSLVVVGLFALLVGGRCSRKDDAPVRVVIVEPTPNLAQIAKSHTWPYATGDDWLRAYGLGSQEDYEALGDGDAAVGRKKADKLNDGMAVVSILSPSKAKKMAADFPPVLRAAVAERRGARH